MVLSEKTKQSLIDFNNRLKKIDSSSSTCNDLYYLMKEVINYSKSNSELQSIIDPIDRPIEQEIIYIIPKKSKNLYSDKSKKLFDQVKEECLFHFRRYD